MLIPSSISHALSVLEGAYDERGLAALRLLVAAAGLLALLAEASRDAERRPVRAATRARVGVLLGLLGALAYFQFLTFGYEHFLHRSEAFHYYVGARYFPELGHEGLYRCAAVATVERGGQVPAHIRDLHTNLLTDSAAALADPDRCRRAFTAERWASFVEDIDRFRRQAGAGYWAVMQQDHGYNATPAWTVVGRLVSEVVPSTPAGLRALAAVDPLLMAGAVGLLWWAWGWRVASLAALFWGAQGASTLFWTGGSILRQDWVFASLAALCLLRRRRPALAGVALAYAALARLFPAVFFLGAAVVAVTSWRRRRRWRRDDVRFFGGALALTLLLVPASLVVAGPRSWIAFAEHLAMHNDTPTTNRMGWKAVVSHSAQNRMELHSDPGKPDPFARWKSLRVERLRSLWWLHRGGIALALVVFVAVCARLRSRWVAVALGATLLPVLMGLSCYYYSFLLMLCPLARARRPVELATLAAAALSQVAALKYSAYDDRYVAMSLIFLVYSAFVLLLFRASRPRLVTPE